MKPNLGPVALLAGLTLVLEGCAIVGTAFVSAPVRLPARETLPPLTEPLTFDVCPASRRSLGDTVQSVLSQVGVPARLTPVTGTPVSFTVSLHQDCDCDWIGVALVTASLVPGYIVERKTLEVHLASREAENGAPRERLEYRARTTSVLWLPLVVHPDVLFSPDKAWESAKSKDGGLTRMIERLGDDIRARMGSGGKAAVGVSCDPADAAK